MIYELRIYRTMPGRLPALKVRIRHGYIGAWRDYRCGAKGDVVGLVAYVLTGDTRDREEQIDRFQGGDVPVFLISLKTGGVGLNLTAADTVIHYDPWWNPAVENQATDRAHRLGQDKPVFVYKLIVAGSIEEKILALQERKAALAASILTADSSVRAKFGSEDIAALFAPLPH